MADTIADRIQERLDALDLKPRAVSMQATEGKDPDLLRDVMRRGRKIETSTMLRLAEILETSVEWLAKGGEDAAERAELARTRVKTEVAAAGAADSDWDGRGRAALPPMPHLGAAIAHEDGDIGEDIEMMEMDLGEVLEWVIRPPSVANDPNAYELTIVGDSMAPRYRPKDRVTVSPRAPVSVGDDVIVQLKGAVGEDERTKFVLAKELARRGAGWVELKQYNPEKTFRVELRRIAALHKIRGARYD